MKIKLIAAIAQNRAIGTKNNTIPWNPHPEDMAIFAQKTKSEGGVVLMGRNTYESLPEQHRPLKQRRNIVLTREPNWRYPGVETFKDVDAVLEKVQDIETLWVIGGGSLYSQFIGMADELHISHFDITPKDSSVFFPEIDLKDWQVLRSEQHPPTDSSPSFMYTIYIKK
jgi:dihydrofolate reductase